MGLEAATFISQLVPSNPVGATDAVSEGDDHTRMLKTVLQACFPNASKPFRFPSAEAQNANFSVAGGDQNKTFVVTTTSGAITATLPSLGSGDAGFECFFLKITTDTNPLFITPLAGTIQSGEYTGLSKTRRCIPGRRTRVLWTGNAWIAERVESSPIGTVLDSWLSGTPTGYEPANGTSLSSAANYPDYSMAKGGLTVPDCTGRVVAGLEAVATRLTPVVSGIDGAALGSTGGAQSVVLVQANLPNVALSSAGLTGSVSTTITNGTAVTRNFTEDRQSDFDRSGSGNGVVDVTFSSSTLSLASGAVTFGGTVPLNGSGTPVVDAQPTIVLRKIIVVE